MTLARQDKFIEHLQRLQEKYPEYQSILQLLIEEVQKGSEERRRRGGGGKRVRCSAELCRPKTFTARAAVSRSRQDLLRLGIPRK